MELSIGTRGRRSSMVRRYFPDLRSFIISTIVILLLLTLAVIITDQNNVRRLHRYLRAAETDREACYSLIEQRLAYAKALVRIIDGQVDTGDLEEAILQWDPNAPVDVVSTLYRALDDELSHLQRKAVEHDAYRDLRILTRCICWSRIGRYFGSLSATSNVLQCPKGGFPALCCKRHNLEHCYV